MYKSNPVGLRILKNFDFLKQLSKINSDEKRWNMLKSATREELLSIVEVSFNIIKSKFCLSKRQKDRLFPYVKYIRKLARVRTEKSARKIVQKGNGAIFTALLVPIIAEATRYLISKVRNNGKKNVIS